MDLERQKTAPICQALEALQRRRVVPFDVPGHKRGRGNPELAELLGEKCLKMDVNSMKPLDSLCNPVSVIRDAEELAAEAFGAAHAYFMVGGTTSSVQTMVLSVCRAGQKIILPRNVHKSVINALILCGDESLPYHYLLRHPGQPFAESGGCPFWDFARPRLRQFKGLSWRRFPLYLKELVLRFNLRGQDMLPTILAALCAPMPKKA